MARMGPILEALAKRPTFILKRPLVVELSEKFGFQVAEAIPEAEAKAIEIIKEKWGEKLAAGVIDKLIAELERKGISVPPHLRQAMIDAWATIVTRGLIY